MRSNACVCAAALSTRARGLMAVCCAQGALVVLQRHGPAAVPGVRGRAHLLDDHIGAGVRRVVYGGDHAGTPVPRRVRGKCPVYVRARGGRELGGSSHAAAVICGIVACGALLRRRRSRHFQKCRRRCRARAMQCSAVRLRRGGGGARRPGRSCVARPGPGRCAVGRVLRVRRGVGLPRRLRGAERRQRVVHGRLRRRARRQRHLLGCLRRAERRRWLRGLRRRAV